MSQAIAINPDVRFLLVSSAEVYQNDAKEFASVEELVPDDTRLLGPSALSAALCEHLLSQTKEQTGNYCILRPRAVYGIEVADLLELVEPC